MQFGPERGLRRLSAHPRRGSARCSRPRCRPAVHARRSTEMYPQGGAGSTLVDVPELSGILCGEFRPGHFDGVATVVAMLLNLVQPDVGCLRREGLPAAHDHPPLDRGPVPARADRRRADGARRRRPRDEFAQPVPESAGARHRTAGVPRARPCPAAARVRRRRRGGHRARGARRAGRRRASGPITSKCGWPARSQPHGPNVDVVVLMAARLGRARLIDNVQCRAAGEVGQGG